LRSGKENPTLTMHCAARPGLCFFSKFIQRYDFTRCARSPNAGLDSFAPAALGFSRAAEAAGFRLGRWTSVCLILMDGHVRVNSSGSEKTCTGWVYGFVMDSPPKTGYSGWIEPAWNCAGAFHCPRKCLPGGSRNRTSSFTTEYSHRRLHAGIFIASGVQRSWVFENLASTQQTAPGSQQLAHRSPQSIKPGRLGTPTQPWPACLPSRKSWYSGVLHTSAKPRDYRRGWFRGWIM